MDFVFAADHKDKMKESETIDKYQDLARELKRLWNMSVTVIAIVFGALGIIAKRRLKQVGLVSFFNGTSTFMGYLMPKSSL